MGARNPDTVSFPPMAMQAITVAEIRAIGWTVRATCGRCRISLHTDLNHMVAIAGPDMVLWGKHPRCKVWAYGDDERCTGRILFEVRSIKGGSWRAMRWTDEVRAAVEMRSQSGSQDR